MKRGGKKVYLGIFATAEEAALCVARSPEGQAAKSRKRNAASAGKRNVTHINSELWNAASTGEQRSTLTHLYPHLHPHPPPPSPPPSLNSTLTSTLTHLHPQAPLTSEEALQQAQAEGLVLLVTGSKTGYYGVYHSTPGSKTGYQARVRHGGKQLGLGNFATAKEAALCVARVFSSIRCCVKHM